MCNRGSSGGACDEPLAVDASCARRCDDADDDSIDAGRGPVGGELPLASALAPRLAVLAPDAAPAAAAVDAVDDDNSACSTAGVTGMCTAAEAHGRGPVPGGGVAGRSPSGRPPTTAAAASACPACTCVLGGAPSAPAAWWWPVAAPRPPSSTAMNGCASTTSSTCTRKHTPRRTPHRGLATRRRIGRIGASGRRCEPTATTASRGMMLHNHTHDIQQVDARHLVVLLRDLVEASVVQLHKLPQRRQDVPQLQMQTQRQRGRCTCAARQQRGRVGAGRWCTSAPAATSTGGGHWQRTSRSRSTAFRMASGTDRLARRKAAATTTRG